MAPNSFFIESASQKAFEIAYAVLRVSEAIGKRAFRERLENQSLILIESVLTLDCEKAREAIWIIEYIIKLGADVGVVSKNNSSAIIAESESLSSAIAEFGRSATLPNLDFEGIFSKGLNPKDVNEKKGKHKDKERSAEKIKEEKSRKSHSETDDFPRRNDVREIDIDNEDIKKLITIHNSAKIAEYAVQVRKDAILQRIKQKGECKMKDIQEIMPDLNERTLRHDLQAFAEQGIIERVGSSGPSTYYRLRDGHSDQKDDSFHFDIDKLNEEVGAGFEDAGTAFLPHEEA